MSSAKKILTKLESISSKLDEVLNRLDKLEKKTVNSKKTASASSTPNVKVGKVLVTEYDKYIMVTGDTFGIRNDFKVYRGKWDGESKGWKIMTSNIESYEDFKKFKEIFKFSTELFHRYELKEPRFWSKFVFLGCLKERNLRSDFKAN